MRVLAVECQQSSASSGACSVAPGAESACAVDSSERSYQEAARGTEGKICSATTRKVYPLSYHTCNCMFHFFNIQNSNLINQKHINYVDIVYVYSS